MATEQLQADYANGAVKQLKVGKRLEAREKVLLSARKSWRVNAFLGRVGNESNEHRPLWGQKTTKSSNRRRC